MLLQNMDGPAGFLYVIRYCVITSTIHSATLILLKSQPAVSLQAAAADVAYYILADFLMQCSWNAHVSRDAAADSWASFTRYHSKKCDIWALM